MILSGEQIERGDNVREVGDKFVIKIHKPKEGANTLDRGRGFPFLDGREFDGVHLNLSLTNDHAKEFNACNVKGVLGELKR